MNELYLVKLPHSEACDSMRVGGLHMVVQDVGNGMAQLFRLDGAPYSFPITAGEAGLAANHDWPGVDWCPDHAYQVVAGADITSFGLACGCSFDNQAVSAEQAARGE